MRHWSGRGVVGDRPPPAATADHVSSRTARVSVRIAVPPTSAPVPASEAATSSSGTTESRRRPGRSISVAVVTGSNEFRRLDAVNAQLQRINSRIDRKFREYQQEAEASRHLLGRAQRLSHRLDLLKVKLQMCFDVHGVQRPPNLRDVLTQMDLAPEDSDDAPPEFICPITQCIMIDPVRTCDGHRYDRAAIQEWFLGFELKGQLPTSPLTNLVLSNKALDSDVELRRQIQAHLAAKHKCNHDGDGIVGPAADSRRPPRSDLAAPGSLSVESTTMTSRNSALGANPIWSSSVVPLHEANSRALNLLRVSELDVSREVQMIMTNAGGSVTRSSGTGDAVLTRSELQRQLQERAELRDVMRRAAAVIGPDGDDAEEAGFLEAEVAEPAAAAQSSEVQTRRQSLPQLWESSGGGNRRRPLQSVAESRLRPPRTQNATVGAPPPAQASHQEDPTLGVSGASVGSASRVVNRRAGGGGGTNLNNRMTHRRQV